MKKIQGSVYEQIIPNAVYEIMHVTKVNALQACRTFAQMNGEKPEYIEKLFMEEVAKSQ
jgi:dihydrofolate reductase